MPAFFAVAYIAIIAGAWGGSEGGFSSLAGVASLFANRWLLLAGWTHYLAFDLLVGEWEVRDSRERGIPAPAGRAVPGADIHVRPGGMAALSAHPKSQ